MTRSAAHSQAGGLARHRVRVITLVGAAVLSGCVRVVDAQGAVASLTITLTRQYLPGALCRLEVAVAGDTGVAALRCGISPDAVGATDGRSTAAERRQELSPADVATLRRLIADARLFDGGHVGVDLRYADVFFELLILRGSQAVALITTGNATFATGPRQALLDWLRLREQGLRPRARPSAEARSVESMVRIRGRLRAPTSAPVSPGRSYQFQVGHCGLLDVVEFSGSYWVVDETTLSAGERGEFGVNANAGTMTLVDSETAVFRSGAGGEATLRRYVGVLDRGPCF